MTALLSFCNDCDLMTRRGFEEVHDFLESLSLPAGDSCWLFDPSGGDMGLFTHDVNHRGPQHDWLLDQISAGVIDVIHSVGSYGERFNLGYRPTRGEIEKALAYLDKHAVVPRIWTNHGDTFNTQNIGGQYPASHHEGDLLGSQSYCLDLLHDHGVEYFWLDRLIWRKSNQPYRVTAPEKCRDGREIETFTRYLSSAIEWSPNGANIAQQIQLAELRNFGLNGQDTIFYTHWGCHHQGFTAKTPAGHTLTPESRIALSTLAQQSDALDLQVVRLKELLDANRIRPVSQEIERVGEIIVRPEKDKPDCFYYNQYAKHGVDYFRKRLKGMEIGGSRALDAGCGVGQWSYALTESYDEVYGIETSSSALTYLDQMKEGLRLPNNPQFTSGSIEFLPYDDKYFDFILCYGVLFCASMRRSLQEFSRVLTREGTAYICINGDGWYEYLIDERFKAQSDEFLISFAEPIWNALVARAGGEKLFIELISRTSVKPADLICWEDHQEVRSVLESAMASVSDRWAKLIGEYSDRTIKLLGRLTLKQLSLQKQLPPQPKGANTALLPNLLEKILTVSRFSLNRTDSPAVYFPLDGIGSTNRAVLPDELAAFAQLVGMRMVDFSGDAGLCKDSSVHPIYASTFNRHDSVWECFLEKG